MRTNFLKQALITTALMALPAMASAQTIDAKGAENLTSGLKTYLGKTVFDKKVVAIAPGASAYRVTIDVKPLAGIFGYDTRYFRMDPFSIDVAPRADGLWSYKITSLPPIALVIPENENVESEHLVTLQDYAGEGVFDPKLPATIKFDDKASKIEGVGKSKLQDSSAIFNGWTSTVTGTPQDGGVSYIANYTVQSFNQHMSIKDEDDANGGMKLDYTGNPYVTNAKIDALRVREISDIWAFLIASSDNQKKLQANPAPLKAKLKAALPLWNRLNSDGYLNNVKVESPFGTFSAKSFAGVWDMSGITAVSDAKFGLKFEDLSIPASLISSETAQFVPTMADVSIAVKGKNLDQAANLFIDNLNLKGKEPISKAVSNQITAKLMAGDPKVILPKSRVVSPAYDITFEGETSKLLPQPYGTMTVTAKNFDATVQALQKVGETNKDINNFATMAAMAKGFGKKGAEGETTWLIMIDDQGMLVVNGQKIAPVYK